VGCELREETTIILKTSEYNFLTFTAITGNKRFREAYFYLEISYLYDNRPTRVIHYNLHDAWGDYFNQKAEELRWWKVKKIGETLE